MGLTDREILANSLDKAIANGFVHSEGAYYEQMDIEYDLFQLKAYYSIIFSHPFAKAFWGNKVVDDRNGQAFIRPQYDFVEDSNDKEFPDTLGECYAWQYHLQQMVISDNPIQYLRRFL